MTWHTTAPIGNISVKANRTILQDNFTYTEVNMGNEIVGTNTVTTRDHFWNVSSDIDGRHRFIQSVGFTVGGNPEDPLIGTGMDGVMYLKKASTDIDRIEGFYRNTNGIYQFIPSFLQGTAIVGSGYTTIVAIPKNVYGEVMMWTTATGRYSAVWGFFRSDGTKVEGWSVIANSQGDGNDRSALKLGNGSEADVLNLRARPDAASSGLTWNYRITYRAI